MRSSLQVVLLHLAADPGMLVGYRITALNPGNGKREGIYGCAFPEDKTPDEAREQREAWESMVGWLRAPDEDYTNIGDFLFTEAGFRKFKQEYPKFSKFFKDVRMERVKFSKDKVLFEDNYQYVIKKESGVI